MDRHLKSVLKKSYNENYRLREDAKISEWKEEEINRLLIHLDKKMEPITLLDLGAGTGIYSRYFQDRRMDVTCIDISEEMVKLCQEKKLHAQVMDFYHLEFEERTFDAVWSLNTLLHVPKKSLHHVLQEVRRVLKEDGIFYMGMYGGEDFEGVWEEDHYEPKRFFSFYTDEQIITTVQKHFIIKEFNKRYLEDRQMHFQSFILKKM